MVYGPETLLRFYVVLEEGAPVHWDPMIGLHKVFRDLPRFQTQGVQIWEFQEIGGPVRGGPCNKNPAMLGSI